MKPDDYIVDRETLKVLEGKSRNENMSIKCLRCGGALRAYMEKCPKCGSMDREITIEDSAKLHELIGIKQKAEGYHRFKKYIKTGEKISKNGKLARETLIIDKEKKQKYHLVKEQDKEENGS